jgi:hypothetical protein
VIADNDATNLVAVSAGDMNGALHDDRVLAQVRVSVCMRSLYVCVALTVTHTLCTHVIACRRCLATRRAAAAAAAAAAVVVVDRRCAVRFVPEWTHTLCACVCVCVACVCTCL